MNILLNSDKLFINNVQDALYKVNYTLKYKITNPVEFYKYVNNFQELIDCLIKEK